MEGKRQISFLDQINTNPLYQSDNVDACDEESGVAYHISVTPNTEKNRFLLDEILKTVKMD
ncbi:MAG: hypothetical protein FJY91_02080 [Candidatus Harrisonbacteria bacterium]|nr:hypothetical protein [Candidatus Harrisonbacteria bacterium]